MLAGWTWLGGSFAVAAFTALLLASLLILQRLVPLLPLSLVPARLAWFARHPFHRFWLWFVYAVQLLLGGGRLQPRTVEAVRRKASELANGLAHYGDDFHEQALQLLLPAFSAEWRPYGQMFPFPALLAAKLAVADHLREHPEVTATVLRRPVFLVSLPRTGSTLLHKLLSLDPRARTMRSWELRNPMPPPEAATFRSDPRVAELRKGTAIMYALHPNMRNIHYVEADDPDECVNGYMDCSAPVYLWGALGMDEAYKWYTESSMEPQFRNYRRLLQVLCHKVPAVSHTVLKSPHHAFHMASLNRVFPGSTFIWLHRHPRNAVGSCCSMNLEFREYTTAGFESPKVLGRRTMLRLADAIRATARDRPLIEQAGGTVVDVFYPELISDPVACVKRIYSTLGLEWSEQFGDSIRAHVANRSKPSNTKGRHAYTLEQFGLTEEDIAENFHEYLGEFGDRLKMP